MSDTKLPVSTAGLDFYGEITSTQFVIPAGAGATFSASGNIATITTNAAHGLTFAPAAGVAPNFYVQFATTATVTGGTGVLVGNTFRILTIPSTTTFTIYTTVTAATVTATTFNPVFAPPFFAQQGSVFANPAFTGQATVPLYPQLQSGFINATLAANIAAQYSPLNVGGVATAVNLFLDSQTTPAAGTPAVAPTLRNLAAASTNGQVWLNPPQGFLIANGTTATSFWSLVI
jgi:hypothetical protein